MTTPKEIIVDQGDADLRVDRVVGRHFPDLSRRQASELVRDGIATVNGRKVAPSHRCRVGDRLRLAAEDIAGIVAEDSGDVRTVVEHADVVVVDKPGGMPSAPLAAGERGTVANVLAYRYPEMKGIGYRPREPGLIHRLDTGTSGLLVAARTPAAFERLVRALRAGAIEKRYLAVVFERGLPGSGIVDEPLAPAGARGRRIEIVSPTAPGAREAVTRWTKRAISPPWALVEVSAPHAYRHQIRAHLAYLGHPIVGDMLYGGPAGPLETGRHALHASYVAWAGDDTVAGFTAESALPDDLCALVRA